MKYVTFTICFGLFVVIHCKSQTKSKTPQPMWNATFIDKLRSDLLLNYDKFARPTEHFNRTNVSFGMNIRHIEVDEAKSTLTVNCWLRMVWFDEKLKWNPDDYGGVGTLNLAEHEIWQPDIHLHNSAASTSINNYGGSHCVVYHNGEVLWVPPAVFTVLCSLNLKYWPFDTQDCYMRFSSWTYNGDQITLKNYRNSTVVETDLVVNNREWLIEKSSQSVMNNVYPCCEETYPDITVNLTISRISPAYKSIIITPTVVIITTILMSFWLPPQAGEKILMNLCTSLMICLCMFYFVQKLPAMGNHTPLIVLFYSCCLYITTFSTISSIIVIIISRMEHKNPLPWVIKYPLTGTIGKIFLLGSYINQSSITHHITAEEMLDHRVTTDFDDDDCSTDGHNVLKQTSTQKISHQQDWILLAAALDRIAFILNCIIFCILIFVYAI